MKFPSISSIIGFVHKVSVGAAAAAIVANKVQSSSDSLAQLIQQHGGQVNGATAVAVVGAVVTYFAKDAGAAKLAAAIINDPTLPTPEALALPAPVVEGK